MSKKYIAIDLGAESGRIMVGELAGSAIALTEAHRFANTPIKVPHANGESLCWDIQRLWNDIKLGLANVADAHDPASIAGIGVDTWGVDFALLDAHGTLVSPPVCYRDARTTGMIEAVFARMPREKIYAATGIQTMSINTLFHLASMSLCAAPELKAARHILFMPDLFTYWLSGKLGTEYTIASTSQMLDARSRQWSTDVCRAIGIDEKLFPPLVLPCRPESIRGTIQPSANEKLAAAGVKVITVGSHDTASAVAAVPATGNDWLYLSSGTWSLLGAEVDQPILTAQAAACNITNEGGIGGTIRLLKNIAGLFLLQECRRHWAQAGDTFDYETLSKLAQTATPNLATLDLDDPTFASPGDMPVKIAAQCRRTNQPTPTTPGQFTRVILESLATSYATVRIMLEEITGKKFRTLHIVGGGSRNDLLNQLAANATGMRVLAGPVEATALGNILCQAISLGHLKSMEEGRTLVAKSAKLQVFEPRQTK